ncbi:hypothetical protein RCOM_1437290 [Ricinus communis]|uniref:Uncharacterized protein n=1 Tax=Ricinus communis TaxID=3988 RepID=B9RFU3_RICCO|nr:hypothetical protein RCOM_1437290 [Ricinus communis]
MRIILMCFSILQLPRCRQQERFHCSTRNYGKNSSFSLLGSKVNGLEGGYSRRWIRKYKNRRNKLTNIRHGVLDETVSTKYGRADIYTITVYQKPSKTWWLYTIIVVHNGCTFDAPLLINEFKSDGSDVPSDWPLMDTLPLARKWTKSKGPSLRIYIHMDHQLIEQGRCEVIGKTASDVTSDLKATLPRLVAESFTVSEAMDVKKKKKKKKN